MTRQHSFLSKDVVILFFSSWLTVYISLAGLRTFQTTIERYRDWENAKGRNKLWLKDARIEKMPKNETKVK